MNAFLINVAANYGQFTPTGMSVALFVYITTLSEQQKIAFYHHYLNRMKQPRLDGTWPVSFPIAS
jgi:hypothetical protein